MFLEESRHFQDFRNLITVCFLRPYDSGIKQVKPSKCVVNIPNCFCQKLSTRLLEQHTSGMNYQNYVALISHRYQCAYVVEICLLQCNNDGSLDPSHAMAQGVCDES